MMAYFIARGRRRRDGWRGSGRNQGERSSPDPVGAWLVRVDGPLRAGSLLSRRCGARGSAPKSDPDFARYAPGGSPRRLWLRTRHQPRARRAGGARSPLRNRHRGVELDSSVARDAHERPSAADPWGRHSQPGTVRRRSVARGGVARSGLPNPWVDRGPLPHAALWLRSRLRGIRRCRALIRQGTRDCAETAG